MWPRVVEVMLGCWIAVSPFVFRHPNDEWALWASDWICASLVVVFALVSYWPPARWMHLATIAVALWMIGFGWMQPRPVPPGYQNEIFLGLTLLMMAIIPSRATIPPPGWSEWYKREGVEGG
ncbi:MAG: SPW repeat protein [Planctomycetes bacterium]|nr:SPW repeat protein [Planctomycetota bacterium]